MITAITHAAYYVSDMQRSIDFYCGKLGFTDCYCWKNDRGVNVTQYIGIPGTMQFIELFPAREGMTSTAGTYYAHLCFQVDDAAATMKELEAKGVEITVPLKMGGDGNWQFWTSDPDGNRIEFMQIMPNSKQVRTARGEKVAPDRGK